MHEVRDATPTCRLNRSLLEPIPSDLSGNYAVHIGDAFAFGDEGRVSIGRMLLQCARSQALCDDRRWSARLVARIDAALAHYETRFRSYRLGSE
jgi:hypothetical protein